MPSCLKSYEKSLQLLAYYNLNGFVHNHGWSFSAKGKIPARQMLCLGFLRDRKRIAKLSYAFL